MDTINFCMLATDLARELNCSVNYIELKIRQLYDGQYCLEHKPTRGNGSQFVMRLTKEAYVGYKEAWLKFQV